MTTNKTMCKIRQSILYLTFLSSEFVDALFASFIGIVQLPFVDTLSATSVISSHVITEWSVILSAYPSFSQLHIKGFQIYYFSNI